MFTKLHNYHHYLLIEHFLIPHKIPYPLAVTPPLRKPLATTNLLSISGFAYSGNFMQKESYNTWPFVSDLFYLV